MSNNNFSVDTSSSILALLSRFGSRQLPTIANFKSLVISIAKHDFMVKPLGALYAISSSIPVERKPFLESMPLDSLWQVHLQSTPTAASILDTIVDPPFTECSTRSNF